MATGTLLPIPRLGIVTSAGALLHVYNAGTSTLATTYSDAGLTTANTNPVIADADGLFGPIYVGNGSFKVVLQDAASNTIFTQDSIASIGQLVSGTALVDICDGRLTLQSGVPVSTDESLSLATTVYYTPYKGNRIALYDGAVWSIYTFNELSISLGSDTAKPYDVFAYVNAGAVAIERVAWTNDSTRATALALQDGVKVKSGSPTRRYLGTYRVVGLGTCADTPTQRFVWNYYNRVPRLLRRTDTTANWTYTTNAWRQANNSILNQVEVVVGVQESVVELRLIANATNSTGAFVAVGIGQDSVANPASVSMYATAYSSGSSVSATPSAALVIQPTEGYHYFPWLEESGAAGTTTWIGISTGLFGTVPA